MRTRRNVRTAPRKTDTNKRGSRKIRPVPVKCIVVPKHRQQPNAEGVADLAGSMKEIGLENPIAVRARKHGTKFNLVAGLHRLQAAKQLGWEHIDATIIRGKTEARLWEIAENLFRKELTVLQRAERTKEWLQLIEKKNRPTERRQRRQRGRPESGVARAVRELPISGKSEGARRKSVERSLRIADISSKARRAAMEAGLDDSQAALLRIAKEPSKKTQLAKVRQLAGRKRTPKDQSGGEKPSRLLHAFGQLARLQRSWNAANPVVRKLFIASYRVLKLRKDEDDYPAFPHVWASGSY